MLMVNLNFKNKIKLPQCIILKVKFTIMPNLKASKLAFKSILTKKEN